MPVTSRWRRKRLELDVGTRNESIARLKTQRYETRKNDEFSAMGREIERYQNEISALEDQELELMEQADVTQSANRGRGKTNRCGEGFDRQTNRPIWKRNRSP